MKLRYLDAQEQEKLYVLSAKFVGIGAKIWREDASGWLFEIFQIAPLDYLIVFSSHYYITEYYVKKAITCDYSYSDVKLCGRNVQIPYQPKLVMARSENVIVLESCHPRKLSHIFQTAFPDAYFAWKPSISGAIK